MEDTTHHVVEAVLPDVPMRQWVLSLPHPIRPIVAFRREIFAAVVRIFLDEIFRCITTKLASDAPPTHDEIKDVSASTGASSPSTSEAGMVGPQKCGGAVVRARSLRAQ